MNTMDNKIAEVVETISKQIEETKCKMIQDKANELGLAVDVKREMSRRFGKVRSCIDDGVETWYYDNGTHCGLWLCSLNMRATEPKWNIKTELIESEIIITIEER